MKKHLLTWGMALMVMTVATQKASAQEEEKTGYQLPDGVVAVELQVNPFSNDFTTFKMAELKGRLFLNNKSVIRLALGLGYDTDTDEKNDQTDTRTPGSVNYTFGTTQTKTDKTQTALKIGVGYEYHFANYGRMDFYVGAEAGYEAKFYSGNKNTVTSVTNSSNGYGALPSAIVTSTNTNEKIAYNKMLPDGSKYNDHSIYANIFTGLDFYVYKSLYIGTELGISFKTSKSQNGFYDRNTMEQSYRGAIMTSNWSETYSSETGISTKVDYLFGQTTVTGGNVTDHSSRSTKVKIYVEPAIRLGWFF